MSNPAPIKIVKVRLNGRGEVFLEIDAPPSEEFMEGFKRYWHKPATYSSGFDHRVFDRFEGTAIVFTPMPVEEFENNHLGVAKDAVDAANKFVVEVYKGRDEEQAAREKAKGAQEELLEAERAKAERIKFDP